jgi:ribosomal protein L23
MGINIEIKGTLARLLATENLIVEHKNVETAMFDVERRVLTLPQWNRASETVYDMLVAHEVGHALFTPQRNWICEKEYFRVPPDYVNVVEDARIEKMMKRRFRGLSKDFYNAYSELNEQDFFMIDNTDVNRMKPIDKINLYFKVGNFVDIEFTDEENEFITRITQAEDFEEVLIIARDIQAYTKQLAEKKKAEQQQQQQQQEGMQGNAQSNTVEPTESDVDGDEENDTDEDPNNAESDPSVDYDDETSDTQQAFGDSQKRLTGGGSDTNYVQLPDTDLSKVVVPFDVIFQHLSEHYDLVSDELSYRYDDLIAEYQQFKRDAAKEVNYLVKEFEMKKSADNYARATTSRTGVLNTSKLHTYKYNEDLFKKVTTIPDGKNHGLVFLLDWSGSMANILTDTMKQLFQLVWFCRKVNIPFDVYAFTNDSWALDTDPTSNSKYDIYNTDLVKEWRAGDISVDGSFRLVNILSSNCKARQTDDMMKYLYIAAKSFGGHYIPYPPAFTLSGTPLNEAIIASRDVVKEMIRKNKIQKVNVICLTDGEGYSPSYNRERKYNHSGEVNRCRSRLGYNTMLRNPRTCRTWKVDEWSFTNKMIECIKDDIPGVSFIGFRILGRGDIRSFASYFSDGETTSDMMQTIIKKQGSICMKLDSFDMMFGIPQSGLNVDSDLNVSEDASKREVSSAFRKMFKGKKTNKFVLQQFANQIA